MKKTKKASSRESSPRGSQHLGSARNTRTKSESEFVRRTVNELPRATSDDLNRLRRAMARSDAQARSKRKNGSSPIFLPIRRDENGRIIKNPPSQIRSAILGELDRRQMTRYQLWKAAYEICPTLTQSAVYEFLRGFRQLGLEYIESLLAALKLRVVTMR
jgi:hypothetical protein